MQKSVSVSKWIALLSTFAMVLALGSVAVAQELPHDDQVRLAEAYRLANQIQDRVWPEWSKAPFAILLVTNDTEFLVNFPRKPEGFSEAPRSLLTSPIYSRPRKFRTDFLATFPALNDPTPVIVIGEPQNTDSKTSTPWLITIMHEHFHQLQYSQPDYQYGVDKLGLKHGDNTGMWMLNYPFPYASAPVAQGFDRLKKLLLDAVEAKSDFKSKAKSYIRERRKFLSSLKDDDRKYFEFQVWQEGLARYTEIKCAQAAADYQPSPEYKQLSDYSDFAGYAGAIKSRNLKELGEADIAKWQRVVFYSFGAAEGLLLDRVNPQWHSLYLKNKFSIDSYFK